MHQAPQEIKDPEVARYDEDFGIYGPLVIGKSTDGHLIAVGIDRFKSNGATLVGDFIVKTRKHKDKQFIVGEFVAHDDDGLPHRIEKNKLSGESTTVTATPEELLDFLADPKVSPHLLNCGKYRKMILPEGNSPAFEEE